jgi:hypothetical protein
MLASRDRWLVTVLRAAREAAQDLLWHPFAVVAPLLRDGFAQVVFF